MNRIKLLAIFILLSSCVTQVPQYSVKANKKQQRTWNINSSVKTKYDRSDKRIRDYLNKSGKINLKRKKKLNKKRSGEIVGCHV